MAAQTIYDILDETLLLKAVLLDSEIDDVDEAIQAYLASSAEQKFESYCKLIRSLDRESDALRAERDDLYAKLKARENAAQRLKDRLAMFMQASGQAKLPAGVFSISTQQSQSVDVLDVDALPEQYRRVKVEPDKTAIKEALKSGAQVPGAQLVESTHVRIR